MSAILTLGSNDETAYRASQIEPDLLMLDDEPTNHLGLEAVIWLERCLQDYPHTVIIVSHDRGFVSLFGNVSACVSVPFFAETESHNFSSIPVAE